MKSMKKFLKRSAWGALLGGESLTVCFLVPVGEFFWFSLVAGIALAALGVIISDSVEF